MADLTACFRSIEITPPGPGSPLLGYFTPRISTGKLDPLFCRLALLASGAERLLFVQVDTCLIRREDAGEIAAAASRGSGAPVDRVMVFASHTHTAPALADLFEVRRDGGYASFLLDRVAEAAGSLRPEARVTPFVCRAAASGLSSNRRWYMKDGTVVTNPPRAHPALDRPEGPVDDEVNTLTFIADDGEIAGMFVSIANHADTIGGDMISADWPGLMEKEIRARLGCEKAIVIPMIGAAGNINHFDFSRRIDQTSYREARRLAAAYAEAVAASFSGKTKVSGEPLAAVSAVLEVPGLHIPDAEVVLARKMLEQTPAERGGQAARSNRDLTAEDIFAGDPGVERMFAGSLLELARRGPRVYPVPLQAFRLGPVAFLTIPGEPFVEIGLSLKRLSGFRLVIPVCLANGYLGYIPLAECFDRGGYEVRPGPALLGRDAAQRILRELARLAALAGTG